MALPPIVTNSSLYKVLSGGQDKKPKAADKPEGAAKAAPTKDTVSLSVAALKKLDELKSTAIDTQEKARQVAGDVRDTLAQNPGITLSGDPQGL